MPRKATKAARQSGRQRRPATARQVPAQAPVEAPIETAVADVADGASTTMVIAPRSRTQRSAPSQRTQPAAPPREAQPAAPVEQPQPRTPARQAQQVRRPVPTPVAGSSLASEQVRNEVRYIRGDITRLLLTTLAVIIFMFAAYYLVNILAS